jgi:hypothetical protein
MHEEMSTILREEIKSTKTAKKKNQKTKTNSQHVPHIPMTKAISGVNTNGERSRLKPNFDLKLPRK